MARNGTAFSRTVRAGVSVVTLAVGAAVAAGVVESPLEVEGRVSDVVVLDVNGDALHDLLVLSVTGHAREARRRVSIFLQAPARSYPGRPTVTWLPDPEMVALDPYPAAAAAEERPEVLSLHADGVYGHAFRDDPPGMDTRRILETSLPHLVPDEESIAVLDFARDWIGGGADLVVPEFPRPRLYRRLADGYGGGVVLDVPPVASYTVIRGDKELRGASLVSTYAFPMPEPSDLDGDGRLEIAFVERSRVTAFDPPEKPAGDPGAKLAGRTYPVRILSPEEADTGRYAVQTRLTDLDGDGRADLVAVIYRDAGVLELEGRVMVFRAWPDGSYPAAPDQVLRVPDALYSLVQVLDLDGDGTMEIVVPSAKLGLWGYLRLLTTRKASFQFNTLGLGDGGFDDDDFDRDSVTARLSQRFDLPVIKLADMNGDGVIDLLIGSGEDRVCVHDGRTDREGQRFRPKPRLCYEADPYARYVIADLDGDSRAELVRHGTGEDDRGRVIVAFLED